MVENYETTADATKAANGLNQYEVIRQGALSFTLTHDAAGNLTGDGTWVYTYDVENRLIRADGPATSAVYLYDPLGRRYRKCVVAQAAVAAPCADAAALATDTAYDGDNAMADYDGIDGALVYRYVHGPGADEIIAWWDSGKRSGTARWAYPVTDHLGSTVLTQTETATGAAGILDRFSYSAYGEVSDPTGYPFKFTGRKFDAETNLYYYRARYYSPTIGRFLQTDPIGYGDNLNWYAYVGNDPVNGTDPSGNTGIGFALLGRALKKSLASKTLSVGVSRVRGVGVASAGGSVEAAISFDENSNVSDFGLIFTAEVGGAIDPIAMEDGGIPSAGEIGVSDTFQLGIKKGTLADQAGASAEVGAVLPVGGGISAGGSFVSGSSDKGSGFELKIGTGVSGG